MKRTYILAIFALLVLPGVAAAQVAEVGGFGGVHLLRGNPIGNDGSSIYELDNGWMMGGRLTLNTYRHFGHELSYSYNRTSLVFVDPASGQEFKNGTAAHRVAYDFLAYATPEGSPFRPFVAGGGHFATYAYPGYSATYGGSTKVGFNYGGGFKVRVTPIWGIRFDFRDYRNPAPYGLPDASGWINHFAISAGFSLLL